MTPTSERRPFEAGRVAAAIASSVPTAQDGPPLAIYDRSGNRVSRPGVTQCPTAPGSVGWNWAQQGAVVLPGALRGRVPAPGDEGDVLRDPHFLQLLYALTGYHMEWDGRLTNPDLSRFDQQHLQHDEKVGLRVWIACSRAYPSDGLLEFVPGSHLLLEQVTYPTLTADELRALPVTFTRYVEFNKLRKIQVATRPGDVVLLQSRTLARRLHPRMGLGRWTPPPLEAISATFTEYRWPLAA